MRCHVSVAFPRIQAVTGQMVIGVYGRNLTLEVGVSGDVPEVTPSGITWRFKPLGDDTTMDILEDEGHVFSDDRWSLYFNNLTFSDEGSYTIMASNVVGRANITIDLDVESKCLFYQVHVPSLCA